MAAWGAVGLAGAIGAIAGAGGGLWPRIKERTPAPMGAAASLGLGRMSVPKSRPKPCFAIPRSLWKEFAGHNAFFSTWQKLDIRPDGIIFQFVILTKIFVLKLLLGFGFGLIILALL